MARSHDGDDVEARGAEAENSGLTTTFPESRYYSLKTVGMRTFFRIASGIFLFLVLAVGTAAVIVLLGVPQDPIPPVPKKSAPLLLLSIDGFRYDYWDKPNLQIPTLRQLRKNGTFVEKLIPIFPANTFPNHYTLVTGLYAESHGIIDNTMYDPDFDALFYLGSPETQNPRWWQDGEPIWVTAEKQNVTTGTLFWPGSDVPIKGILPTYYLPYDGALPHANRVAKILEWLDKPESERPRFLTLYYSEVDSMGHEHGPDSQEVFDSLERVDQSIAELISGLSARNLLSEMNIVVVGDHGMAQIDFEQKIALSDYINITDVRIIKKASASMVLFVPQERVAEIYDALRDAHPKMTAYTRELSPERFHYRNNRRIGEILVVAEEGWYITDTANSVSPIIGHHGYDNRAANMSTLFIGSGPAFKHGATYAELENIHVYQLMCSVLGIEAAPNNGTQRAFRHLLV